MSFSKFKPLKDEDVLALNLQGNCEECVTLDRDYFSRYHERNRDTLKVLVWDNHTFCVIDRPGYYIIHDKRVYLKTGMSLIINFHTKEIYYSLQEFNSEEAERILSDYLSIDILSLFQKVNSDENKFFTTLRKTNQEDSILSKAFLSQIVSSRDTFGTNTNFWSNKIAFLRYCGVEDELIVLEYFSHYTNLIVLNSCLSINDTATSLVILVDLATEGVLTHNNYGVAWYTRPEKTHKLLSDYNIRFTRFR